MNDFNNHIKLYQLKGYPHSIHKWRIIAESHPLDDRDPYSRISIKTTRFGFEKVVIRYRAEYLTGDSVYFPVWNNAKFQLSSDTWVFPFSHDVTELREEIKQYCHNIKNYLYELRNSRYEEQVSWQGVSNDLP